MSKAIRRMTRIKIKKPKIDCTHPHTSDTIITNMPEIVIRPTLIMLETMVESAASDNSARVGEKSIAPARKNGMRRNRFKYGSHILDRNRPNAVYCIFGIHVIKILTKHKRVYIEITPDKKSPIAYIIAPYAVQTSLTSGMSRNLFKNSSDAGAFIC